MRWLLNLAYLVLLAAVLPWLLYVAWVHGKYRHGLAAKFLGSVPRRPFGHRPCMWLHGVSVGEINLLSVLLRQLQAELPEWDFIVSTTTRAGYALACRKLHVQSVFYCPLDFSWSVNRAMRRLRPQLLILAELELWPNLIASARRHAVPVCVVNGRLSPRSYRGYRMIRLVVARFLKSLELIAVQSPSYADRFLDLGADRTALHVTGSLKFDGATLQRDNPETQRLAALAGISNQDVVLLAGSTQEPEEALALETYQHLSPRYPELRLILVPRHPERFPAVARMLQQSGVRWQRRSRLEREAADPTARVLLVDTVGELGAWWGTAQIAFVGGSLTRRGGQNMIEPAAYGAAVSFGPNTENFRDVVAAMLAEHAAVVVPDGNELTAFVQKCLARPDWRRQMGCRAQRLVQQQQGATARTVTLIQQIVAPLEDRRRRGQSRGDAIRRSTAACSP